AEHIPELHALVGQPIDVGGLDVRIAGITESVPADIVAKDEKDVGLLSRNRLRCCFYRECRRCSQDGQTEQTNRRGEMESRAKRAGTLIIQELISVHCPLDLGQAASRRKRVFWRKSIRIMIRIRIRNSDAISRLDSGITGGKPGL